jgi:hypothetical protein
MPRCPIKLCGRNSAGSSFLSQNSEAISEKETYKVVEGQFVFSSVNIIFLIQAQ